MSTVINLTEIMRNFWPGEVWEAKYFCETDFKTVIWRIHRIDWWNKQKKNSTGPITIASVFKAKLQDIAGLIISTNQEGPNT